MNTRMNNFHIFLFNIIAHECPVLSFSPPHFPFLSYFDYWKYICLAPIVCHFPVWNIFFLIFFLAQMIFILYGLTEDLYSLYGFYIHLCLSCYEFLTTKVWIHIWCLNVDGGSPGISISAQLIFLLDCCIFKDRGLCLVPFPWHTPFSWAHWEHVGHSDLTWSPKMHLK